MFKGLLFEAMRLSHSLMLLWADTKLKELVDAAENYHMVLAENRKLYNEVQDLKGIVFGITCQTGCVTFILCSASFS